MNDLSYLVKPKNTPIYIIRDEKRNNVIYLKDETNQYTNAFKYRGVYNKFSKCKNLNSYNGVVTASTGNHGQAVAFAAKQLGIKCVIFVPKTTPLKKIKKIKNFDAVIYKRKIYNYDFAKSQALKFAEKNNYFYISSFDDMDIIQGHMSLFNEVNMLPINYCFCPVGGGGLVSAAIKSLKAKVIGVELEGNDAMNKSLLSKRLENIKLSVSEKNMFCEGILVSEVGKIPFEIALENNLQVNLVNIEDIKNAIRILSNYNIFAEGAGASSLAGYLKSDIKNSTVLCIISGGNIDDSVLNLIMEERI